MALSTINPARQQKLVEILTHIDHIVQRIIGPFECPFAIIGIDVPPGNRVGSSGRLGYNIASWIACGPVSKIARDGRVVNRISREDEFAHRCAFV
jgi:hypothetical protein